MLVTAIVPTTSLPEVDWLTMIVWIFNAKSYNRLDGVRIFCSLDFPTENKDDAWANYKENSCWVFPGWWKELKFLRLVLTHKHKIYMDRDWVLDELWMEN